MKEIALTQGEFRGNPIGFDTYRALCDQASGTYRPIGVQTEEAYTKALSDPRTQLMDTDYGRIPATVPLEMSDGYDVERCKKLTGCESVYLLTAPFSLFKDTLELPEDSVLIVESDHENDQKNREQALTLIHSPDSNLEIVEFQDARLKDEEHRNAYMGIYAGKAEYRGDGDVEVVGSNLKEVFRALNKELVPENGVSLFDASDIIAHPEVLEELWQLFKNRFEWLGDYHPVSMEDTREVFDAIVESPNTFVPLKFKDGKLVCAGIIVNEMRDIGWISESTINRLELTSKAESATLEYFFGIAAVEGDEMMHNMEEVVHFHSELAAGTGKDFIVVFESSNLSSLYIPQKTAEYINSSKYHGMKNEFKSVGRIDYWFVKPKS